MCIVHVCNEFIGIDDGLSTNRSNNCQGKHFSNSNVITWFVGHSHVVHEADQMFSDLLNLRLFGKIGHFLDSPGKKVTRLRECNLESVFL